MVAIPQKYDYARLRRSAKETARQRLTEKNVEYTAFGSPYAANTVSAVDNRYTYTGREKSAVGGAPMYYRNRTYSPSLGRFGRRDPIGYIDGPSLYAYANNNPGNSSDPYGLFSIGAIPLNVMNATLQEIRREGQNALDRAKADLDRAARMVAEACNPCMIDEDKELKNLLSGIANTLAGIQVGLREAYWAQAAERFGQLAGSNYRQSQAALDAALDVLGSGGATGTNGLRQQLMRRGQDFARAGNNAANTSGGLSAASQFAKVIGVSLGVAGAAMDTYQAIGHIQDGDTSRAISSGSSAAGAALVVTLTLAKSSLAGPVGWAYAGGQLGAMAIDYGGDAYASGIRDDGRKIECKMALKFLSGATKLVKKRQGQLIP